MSSPKTEATAPILQRLGRSSHLRILAVNVDTVRQPQEGPTGTPLTWSGPNGEQFKATFERQRPQLEPGVLNGERVEWINPTNRTCTIEIHEVECRESPFEDGARKFTIAPGRSVLSGVIRGKLDEHYRYTVKFDGPLDDDGGERGDPVIIVKG